METRDDSIRRWTRDHDVTWELRPLTTWHDGMVRPVGYEVELTCAAPDIDPSSPASIRAWGRLRELAETVLPEPPPDVTCRVRPSAPALRLRTHASGAAEPEIQVTIDVTEHDAVAPIDPRETLCAREIEERLVRLGARRHSA